MTPFFCLKANNQSFSLPTLDRRAHISIIVTRRGGTMSCIPDLKDGAGNHGSGRPATVTQGEAAPRQLE